MFKFDGGHEIQGLVRLLGVVVKYPLVHQLAHMGQRVEQVGVEQFAAKRAVEASDVDILRRFAGLNPVQSDSCASHYSVNRALIKSGLLSVRSYAGRPWYSTRSLLKFTDEVPDTGQIQGSFGTAGFVFIVTAQALVLVQPTDRALHDTAHGG